MRLQNIAARISNASGFNVALTIQTSQSWSRFKRDQVACCVGRLKTIIDHFPYQRYTKVTPF
jgi:hypothetical protein